MENINKSSTVDIENELLKWWEELIIQDRKLDDQWNEVIKVSCWNNIAVLVAKWIKLKNDTDYLSIIIDWEKVPLESNSKIKSQIKTVYLQESMNSENYVLSTLRNSIFMWNHLEDWKKAVEEILEAS